MTSMLNPALLSSVVLNVVNKFIIIPEVLKQRFCYIQSTQCTIGGEGVPQINYQKHKMIFDDEINRDSKPQRLLQSHN